MMKHERQSAAQHQRWSAAVLYAGLALAGTGHAVATEANAGKSRAAQCAACHGPDGIAVLPEAPNLAGQVEGYLVKSLKEYRSGARKHEQMGVMAKGLSDRDIENLAAYYHQLPAGGRGAAR